MRCDLCKPIFSCCSSKGSKANTTLTHRTQPLFGDETIGLSALLLPLEWLPWGGQAATNCVHLETAESRYFTSCLLQDELLMILSQTKDPTAVSSWGSTNRMSKLCYDVFVDWLCHTLQPESCHDFVCLRCNLTWESALKVGECLNDSMRVAPITMTVFFSSVAAESSVHRVALILLALLLASIAEVVVLGPLAPGISRVRFNKTNEIIEAMASPA